MPAYAERVTRGMTKKRSCVNLLSDRRREWFNDVKTVLQSFTNLNDLASVGFVTNFTTPTVKKATIGSAIDCVEQLGFRRFWKLGFHMLRSLCGAYIRHTDGYPCLLAGLMHDAPSKCTASFAVFKEHVEAYEAACARTEPPIVNVVKRCPLQSTPMRLAAKLAKAGTFKVPPCLLHPMHI